MATSTLPEVWLRGPLPEIPALLQPIAHALMQALEEVNTMMYNFPEALLWEKPAGLASAGFHLQHLSGVLDRLFTYARGEALSTEQLAQLKSEGRSDTEGPQVLILIDRFSKQVNLAIGQLKNTEENNLTAIRTVGRAQLSSTVIGLLMHAAEHTMRHVGQLLVTVSVVKSAIV